jgi:hypothetical protein
MARTAIVDYDRVHVVRTRMRCSSLAWRAPVKINEITDSGGWLAATDCPSQRSVAGASAMRVLEGATVLIRNTGVTAARYRWVSLREIRIP